MLWVVVGLGLFVLKEFFFFCKSLDRWKFVMLYQLMYSSSEHLEEKSQYLSLYPLSSRNFRILDAELSSSILNPSIHGDMHSKHSEFSLPGIFQILLNKQSQGHRSARCKFEALVSEGNYRPFAHLITK